ncbi:MAG TPA: hypothetical protein VGM51_02980 [Armatimonadota bacterium]|jgi:hypothetical protein
MKIRFGTMAATGIAVLALATAALAFPAQPANPLGLTPAQKEKITAINKKARAEVAAVQMGTGKREEKTAKIAQLTRKYDDDAMAVLTPTQRAKVQARRQARLKQIQQILAVQKTLTPQQKAKAQAINARIGAKARKIQSDPKLSDAQKRAQYMALQKEQQAAELAILTNKQRAALPK